LSQRINGEGYETYLYGGTTVHKWPNDRSFCIDTIGEKSNAHGLWIEHGRYLKKVGRVTREPPGALYTLVDYPFDNQAFLTSHYFSPVVPNDTATITEVQAKTNPSRPEVSIPNFLIELKDIPSMLHLEGKKRIDGMPRSSVIEQNFGWNLLIQDLKKMADFTAQADKRLKELEALHSTKGLSRKRTVFSDQSVGQTGNTYFQSAYNSLVYGFVSWTSRFEKWGSVQWVPDVPFRGTDGELAQQARYLIHGWDFSGAALASILWEALPWSWFIDYFTNVGDYLNSNRNGAGAVAQMGCVMEHRTTQQSHIVTFTDVYSKATPGVFTYETKSRVLASAGITARLPFLSAGQLVTLSSLAQSLAG
jgi:hypothetical protein